MKLAVIGLGHVGSITAACLARAGHEVRGFDHDPVRLAAAAAGRAPVPEPGLAPLMRAQARAGRLRAAGSLDEALRGARVALICVETPARGRLGLDPRPAVEACAQAGRLWRPGQALAVRSTLPLGGCATALAPALPRRARRALCVNPEFSREGSAIEDFTAATRVVVGARDPRAAAAVARAYAFLRAPVHSCSWETAELIKLADNAFHALKVAFANEIGVVASRHGADGPAAMASLASDGRLNASAAYLRPGEPFGGPCLRKDLASLARAAGGAAPLLEGALASNARRLDEAAERLLRAARPRRFALPASGFKPGVEDRRGSVLEELARRLEAAGRVVRRLQGGERPRSGERLLAPDGR